MNRDEMHSPAPKEHDPVTGNSQARLDRVMSMVRRHRLLIRGGLALVAVAAIAAPAVWQHHEKSAAKVNSGANSQALPNGNRLYTLDAAGLQKAKSAGSAATKDLVAQLVSRANTSLQNPIQT